MRTVYRSLQPLRAGTALPPDALPPPKIGEITSWLLRRADDLDPRDMQALAEIRGHCAQLDRLAGHVTSFAKMMTRRTGERDLPGWLERVEADDQPELHTFAAGFRQDLAAVTAELTLPYSTGSTEGNVNRLKAIKRQMYGRATLDLLLANASSITLGKKTTEFAPEPIPVAENPSEWSHDHGRRHMDGHAVTEQTVTFSPKRDRCSVHAIWRYG